MLRRMRREWKRRLAALAATAVLLCSGTALAANLPDGGVVAGGEAAATIATADKTMTIDQKQSNILIDWNSFDIAQGYAVAFNQAAADVAVNNVIGVNPSNISGSLTGAGTIVLVNPNGINFNGSAQVNVGSLVASTLQGTKNADGTYNLSHLTNAVGKNGNIVVNNLAKINAGSKGYVALLAAQKVESRGAITAPEGQVIMAAGTDMTLSYDTAGKINVGVDASTLNSQAINSGTIAAGYVVMTAKTASTSLQNLVKNTGTLQATGMKEAADGTIELVAANGAVNQAGTLTTNGGDITTSGDMVNVLDGSQVHANGGTWHINSNEYTVQVADKVTANGATAKVAGTAVETASNLSVGTINDSLSDTNVAIKADASGTTVTDVLVQEKLVKSAGEGTTTISLQANRNVVVNKGIESNAGALNVLMEADKLANKSNQAGSNVILGDVKTNGGDFETRKATYIGLNNEELKAALAGQRGDNRSIVTKGGNITIKGDIVLATGGSVSFDAKNQLADLSDAGVVDISTANFIQDGNGYYYTYAPNTTWEAARAAAQGDTAGLGGTWDTSLATIYHENVAVAAIEDSIVSSVIPLAKTGTQSRNNQVYIGGKATDWTAIKDEKGQTVGYTRDWEWVTGKEAANEAGHTTFYTTTVNSGKADAMKKSSPGNANVTVDDHGAYNNWKVGEPNSDSTWSKTYTNAAGEKVTTDGTKDINFQRYVSVNYNNNQANNAGEKPQSWDDLEDRSSTASGFVTEVNLPQTEKFVVTAKKLVVKPEVVEETPGTPPVITDPYTKVETPDGTVIKEVAMPATVAATDSTVEGRGETVPQETIGTKNLAGTGSIGEQTAQNLNSGVDRVLGLADGKLPMFKVANKRMMNYGTYEIASTPDAVKLTAATTKKTPRLPEAPVNDSNYRQIDRTLTTEQGTAEFSLTYNGSTLNIYPNDKAAKELISNGEAQQNVELLSKALFSSQGSLGVDVADLDGVVLYADATEAEAGK